MRLFGPGLPDTGRQGELVGVGGRSALVEHVPADVGGQRPPPKANSPPKEWPSTSTGEPLASAVPGSAAEPVDQQSVTQAPIAHGQPLLAQLVHDRPDDAGAGEDDLGALGLQADDHPASLGVA